MKKTMFLSLLILLLGQLAQAGSLKVTSLNIEWYGRGGVISGTPDREYRDTTLKDFLTKNIPKTDVFVFQEITQPDMLVDLFSELECFTYEAGSRHQYVVMCAKKDSIVEMDVNKDVALGRFGLRSALIGKFRFKDKGEFSVVGLHLKAGPYKTETRLNQIRALIKDIDASENTLIIGDLNTYAKERTGLEKDDSELMSELLKEKSFIEITNTVPTYLGYRPRVFDRAWGANLHFTASKVYGPCDSNFKDSIYSDKNFYERFVSDHCALQVEFSLGEEAKETKSEPELKPETGLLF